MKDGLMIAKMILRIRGKFLWPALLSGVLALVLSSGFASAQKTTRDLPPPPPVPKLKPTPTPTPPPQEVLDVVRVTSNLIMVPVSVTDAQGQAVQGLKIEDFRLEEEGRVEKITEMGDPEQVPLDIALLFDISSSVSQKGFFAFQQNAAATFLRLVMKPADKAAVFGISGEPVLIQPLASADVAATKILAIPPANVPVPTAFYDTVAAAAKYLTENSPGRHRRVIIVLSDGDDNFSNRIKDLSIAEARANLRGETTPSSALSNLQAKHRVAVQETQRSVQQADAIFYAVNPGGPSVRMNVIANRSHIGMQAVADATGGTAFLPDSDKDLEKVFRQVAAELRGQYLLQYYGNSEATPGQFRRISVAVPARSELKVRARQGYYAKKGEK
nr:VWA domain-containing protein [Pyrinomonadaceae bacterium]